MHLINELQINLLININIQKSKNITISIFKRRFYIDNCVEFIVTINIVNVEKRIDRLIRIKKIIFLSFYFITNVFIQIRDNFCLSIDKNYMFYSKINFELKSKNNVYFHIVNVDISIIQIRNIINEIYISSRHVKLNQVFNYEKKNCYIITQKNAHLIIKFKKQIFKNSFKLALTKLVNVLILIDELIFTLFIVNNNVVVFNINVFVVIEFVIIEIITSREIIIYDDD